MEGLTACSVSGRLPPVRFLSPSTRSLSLAHRRSGPLPVFSSGDGPQLDKWDQMELKFGRLIGEDPKLTLAKIMGRKSNPDVSYMDIEKSFSKRKSKVDDDLINAPVDESMERQPSDLQNSLFSNQKAQSSPREGKLNLARPIMNKAIKAAMPDEKSALIETQSNQLPGNIETNYAVSNITLRKPSGLQGNDIEADKYSKLNIKPNLFLKMRKGSTENLSDVTLLKKPEVLRISNPDEDNVPSGNSIQSSSSEMRGPPSDDVMLVKPSAMSCDRMEINDEVQASDALQQNNLDGSVTDSMMDAMNSNNGGHLDNNSDCIAKSSKLEDENDIGLQPPKHSGVEEASTPPLDLNSVYGSSNISKQASLIGKPQRMDLYVKEVASPVGEERASLNDESHDCAADDEHFISEEQKEREDSDWKRAEGLLHTGERVEVELISCSGRGFVVSFGSLIGFLPYRNLGAKWKFLAFESWLRKKGLDPSLYRQNLSILGGSDSQIRNLALDSDVNQETQPNDEDKLAPDMKFEDLLEAYDQEKTKFLSSFVGQRIRVTALLADRNSRRLIFSGRPKENEELVERKRSLMAKLSVGDVVKCCITKITYFGIFVEVEGVPALIHQSEVSWDATLDPSSFFKIGQIVEAKVHQLDYALERINLSLKEITPDPLTEALESVVGDSTSLGGSLEEAQADVEWADVESLIHELQQIDGVQNVSKGRFFLSPGLAPTFQVYMASMFDSQYKLLARYGNKVQEVMVQASLEKEQMKSAILTCTNRVE